MKQRDLSSFYGGLRIHVSVSDSRGADPVKRLRRLDPIFRLELSVSAAHRPEAAGCERLDPSIIPARSI